MSASPYDRLSHCIDWLSHSKSVHHNSNRAEFAGLETCRPSNPALMVMNYGLELQIVSPSRVYIGT